MKGRQFVFCLVALMMAVVVHQGTFAAQETIVTVSFQREQFRFLQGSEYDRVLLTDGDAISLSGEPVMPALQLKVAIPAGTEASGVHIRSLDSQELPGTYRIFPGQPSRRLDGSPAPPFVEPNREIYGSIMPYPEKLGQLDGQTDLAGQQMALVRVYPLQYVPAAGQLILHNELEITVETQPGRISGESYARFTEKQRQHYAEIIRGMVINPQDVVVDPPLRGVSKALLAGDFDHVIITSNAYASYFDDLVEWHNKRGLRDTVVTTDSIYAAYSGADDQERIRNFVIDAHSTWGTMYFLMGGEAATVPFRYRTYYAGESTPSDNYYADYDDDWTCEVYVGRITGTSTQWATALNKVLTYERDPQLSDYPLDVLLIGMDLDASTPAENLKETIDGYIPAGFNVTKVYDSDASNHETDTKNALNAGQNLVNHADHCNSDVMGLGYVNHYWDLTRFEVDLLTNYGQPSNVVSLGCWALDFTYNDCVGEHFVIHNSTWGGVSFTGNTRDGWGYVGQPASLSGQLDRDWWRGLFLNGQNDLGHALVWSKHQFAHNTDIRKHCEWTFSLLGDPAMPLWTDTPASMTVTHPSALPVGSSSFTVHVEDGGNLEGAYVCLWKPGEIYLTDDTDANGDAFFNPSPASIGSLYVTVTKYNYLPHEGAAQVTGDIPSPVDDLTIAPSETDLALMWSAPEGTPVDHYIVFRDTTSDFEPAPEDSIGSTPDTSYLDAGAAGLLGTNYFYCVKAVGASGQKSDPSNTVGEIDIGLINAPPE